MTGQKPRALARKLFTVPLAAASLSAVLALAWTAGPAQAQGGWWPWASQEGGPPPPRRQPVPQEPVWRGPGGPGGPGGPQQVPAPIPPQAGPGGKSPICFQLEQRLVSETQRGTVSRDQLPRIEQELRQMERGRQQAQSQLERSECYDYFLFSKTLKRTRQCVDLAGQAEAAKQKVADLDSQRQNILGTRDRSHSDEIYRELARNNCGSEYAKEASRRGANNPFSTSWQEEDTGPAPGRNEFGALPFATYRTVCVRLCDGYFFPVSFSTLKNHFERDVDSCQSKCAAPAELYYYQNPGGAMEQALSVKSQTPYTNLKSAFLYQKKFVQGCSCKQAEYTPLPGDQPAGRRADGAPQSIPVAAPPPRQVQR